MPIFEYKCSLCGHEFEYLKLHSSPEPQCPECQGAKLEQLISLPVFSSEAARDANLKAAHARAAARRSEKHRQQHADSHEHFEDKRVPESPGKQDS